MLSDHELQLLRDAAQSEELSRSVNIYLNLRELFRDSSEAARSAFQGKFSRYYGLRSAGLTAEWHARYFELLFEFDKMKLGEPYRDALLELYEFPRRQGDKVLQFSFVSKLVAFHDEARPLYDRNVREFFGLGPPSMGPIEFRITGFVKNLNEIARRYDVWLQDKRLVEILNKLCVQFQGLSACHLIRLCDFLVHTARANRRL